MPTKYAQYSTRIKYMRDTLGMPYRAIDDALGLKRGASQGEYNRITGVNKRRWDDRKQKKESLKPKQITPEDKYAKFLEAWGRGLREQKLRDEVGITKGEYTEFYMKLKCL